MPYSIKFQFIVQPSVDAVGAAIGRPLQNCDAILKISEGNNPIIAFGDAILLRKLRGRGAPRSESKITMPAGGRHTYTNGSRPYGLYRRLWDKLQSIVLLRKSFYECGK